jgi:hypothetical protein
MTQFVTTLPLQSEHMPNAGWNLTKEDRGVLPAILYVDLLHEITRYRELLQRAKRRGNLDYVAWITRNLLELRIWAEYCGRSAQGADDFICDAVRDIFDLNQKVGGLTGETLAKLEDAKQFVGNARGYHKFRPVADAADEIGLKDFYVKYCKVLSKFVHPTAMSVVARFRGEEENLMRKQFFDLGREIAEDALKGLDSSCLGEAYRKYRATMNRVLTKLPEEIRPFSKAV